jgi:hypothetical protein
VGQIGWLDRNNMSFASNIGMRCKAIIANDIGRPANFTTCAIDNLTALRSCEA